MCTFITRTSPGRSTGLRLAVKDNIDVAGLQTTCGSRAVAATAPLAQHDAACVAQLVSAGACVVGKTNLHELAFGATGINPWFGTPTNPFAPGRIPGGSSSGSAVAVAAGEADIALGSDTGGSVRIPAACCGVVGFKPTNDRVPSRGLTPLAQSLDAVGFIARSAVDATWAMAVQEANFSVAVEPDVRIGRLATSGVSSVEQAVDDALLASELSIAPIAPPDLDGADQAAWWLLLHEAARNHRHLLKFADALGQDVYDSIQLGERNAATHLAQVQTACARFREQLNVVFESVDILACPTLPMPPPDAASAKRRELTKNTRWVNLLGLPALSLPIGRERSYASVQLVGPRGADELVLAVGRRLEAAIASLTPA